MKRREGRRRKAEVGFTLLEIMIALAIIGIALTAIIHTVNYHAIIMYENTLTTRMYQLAKEKMHQLEKAHQNASGDLAYGLKYQNIASPIKDTNFVILQTIVNGNGKHVELNGLAIRKDEGTDESP